MRTILATVDIAPPSDQVWGVLADLYGYPDRNPFIRSASGRATVAICVEEWA